jgi:hypothetical protein
MNSFKSLFSGVLVVGTLLFMRFYLLDKLTSLTTTSTPESSLPETQVLQQPKDMPTQSIKDANSQDHENLIQELNEESPPLLESFIHSSKKKIPQDGKIIRSGNARFSSINRFNQIFKETTPREGESTTGEKQEPTYHSEYGVRRHKTIADVELINVIDKTEELLEKQKKFLEERKMKFTTQSTQ